MKKDIEQLRKEKEREEERKIFQAINDNNKRARERARQQEQQERARREREQRQQDIKDIIKISFVLCALLFAFVVLWVWCENDYQKSVNSCVERGYSVDYCEAINRE